MKKNVLKKLRLWCPQPSNPVSKGIRHKMAITILASATILTISFSLLASTILFHQTPVIPVLPQPTQAAGPPPNSWVQKAPMPTTRSNVGAAAVDGKIYAIGGFTGPQLIGYNAYSDVTTNVTEAYDPKTNAWTEKTPMPIPLSNFGVAVYQNKIYCMGQDLNEVYDPLTDTWETKTPMPMEATQLQAHVVDDKIYLIGGYPNGTINEVYDPTTDSWAIKAPIPTAVADYASAVIDGKIYVISGRVITAYPNSQPENITNLTQVYNPLTNKWSLGAPIPMGVWQAAAGATTGAEAPKAIYVMGGCNATYPLDAQVTNQVYFPENNSWGMAAPMLIDKAWLSVAVVNDTLYAIGGGHNLFTETSTANTQYTPFAEESFRPKTASATPWDYIDITIVAIAILSIIITMLLLRKRSVRNPGFSGSGRPTANAVLATIATMTTSAARTTYLRMKESILLQSAGE
jgi:hypothetical protein